MSFYYSTYSSCQLPQLSLKQELCTDLTDVCPFSGEEGLQLCYLAENHLIHEQLDNLKEGKFNTNAKNLWQPPAARWTSIVSWDLRSKFFIIIIMKKHLFFPEVADAPF